MERREVYDAILIKWIEGNQVYVALFRNLEELGIFKKETGIKPQSVEKVKAKI